MSYVLSKTGEVLQGWKIGLQYLDHETAFTVTYLSLIFKITTNMLKKRGYGKYKYSKYSKYECIMSTEGTGGNCAANLYPLSLVWALGDHPHSFRLFPSNDSGHW